MARPAYAEAGSGELLLVEIKQVLIISSQTHELGDIRL
jgi:hypothetical protein